jgi:hypothetical protein
MNKPDDLTMRATYGLMCAKMAKEMGLTMEETLELISLAWRMGDEPSACPA